VKDPGTTDGIFEEVDVSTETEVREEGEVDTTTMPPEETATGWAATLKTLIGDIHDDDTIEDDVKMKATKMAMKIKQLLNGEGETETDEEEEETETEEAVEVTALIKRIEALEKREPKLKPRPKVKSTARSTVTEDVTPTPKPKQIELPKEKAQILKCYEE
jgi:hypothetical protein